MNIDIIPESHDLLNKPLIEAMFELRWRFDAEPARSTTAFRVLFGKYYEKIHDIYPEVEDLPTSNVPEAMTPYIVRHRFRAASNQWPVIQVGPGIMTVNETAGYRWNVFRERIEGALQALFDSFPRELSPFEPLQTELRYVNMIQYDIANGRLTDFLATHLHTRVILDEKLFDGPHQAEKETALDLSIGSRLTKPRGIGLLSFATGESDKKTGILWQIIVRSHPSHTPKTYEEITQWTRDAHDVVDRWFFTLARGSLMDTFDREPS